MNPLRSLGCDAPENPETAPGLLVSLEESFLFLGFLFPQLKTEELIVSDVFSELFLCIS